VEDGSQGGDRIHRETIHLRKQKKAEKQEQSHVVVQYASFLILISGKLFALYASFFLITHF